MDGRGRLLGPPAFRPGAARAAGGPAQLLDQRRQVEERLATLEKPLMAYAGVFRAGPDIRPEARRPAAKGRAGRPVGRRGRGARVRAETGRHGAGKAFGAGRVDRQAGQPAAGAGDGQPRLALPFRPGHRADAERFRLQRRPPVTPGVARLAGFGISGRRLEAQTAAPADRVVGRLPAVHALRRQGGGCGRRRPAAVAAGAAAPGGGGDPRRGVADERRPEPGAADPDTIFGTIRDM